MRKGLEKERSERAPGSHHRCLAGYEEADRVHGNILRMFKLRRAAEVP